MPIPDTSLWDHFSRNFTNENRFAPHHRDKLHREYFHWFTNGIITAAACEVAEKLVVHRALDAQDRRQLIMDFMALGTIPRWNVCEIGHWLSHADHALCGQGQELWALAFQRAEERNQLPHLRELVDAARHP